MALKVGAAEAAVTKAVAREGAARVAAAARVAVRVVVERVADEAAKKARACMAEGMRGVKGTVADTEGAVVERVVTRGEDATTVD